MSFDLGTVTLSDGRDVRFTATAPPDENRKAGFVMGVRKSGSTLLAEITREICERSASGAVDVGGTLFDSNLPGSVLIDDAPLCGILRDGIVYFGFRDYPRVFEDHPRFVSGSRILLVRDPRDALVSEYFSNAFSHKLPENLKTGEESIIDSVRQEALSNDIDTYVIRRAEDLFYTIIPYVTAKVDFAIYRYEDIVFNKFRFVNDIATVLGIGISEADATDIATKYDLWPEKEDPNSFVRRVTPGDHLEKLTPDTIAVLDDIMRPILDRFGYR